MRVSLSALSLALLICAPALAEDQTTPAIAPDENCFVMKQHVLSVSDARVASVDNPGQPVTITSNRSGDTARDDQAKRDIMAGDSACENNDLASARDYYQRAIDALTSP